MVRGFPKSMDIEKAINKRDGVAFRQEKASGVGFMNTNDDGYHNTEHKLIQEGESSERAKQWHGWGTALKPSFEPIIVARKPIEGTCIDNVLKYGTGGINIDECRIGKDERTYKGMSNHKPDGAGTFRDDNWEPKDIEITVNGRFPANTILTYDDTDFEEVCGGFPVGKKNGSITKRYKINNQVYGDYGYCNEWEAYNDSGSACRYYYCAKASKKDRNDGLEIETNKHPTIKPTALMQYLVRLVTPKEGTVLDPFMGSGSTGKAVAFENKDRNANYNFIGIELDNTYCEIARKRIEWANNYKEENEDTNQINLFDLGGENNE